MAEYDKIAEDYAERRTKKGVFSYNTHIEIPCMIKILGPVKNKTILDLGCGFGDHAERYIKKGARKVYGIDISGKLVKTAKKRNIPKTAFSVYDLNKKLKFRNNYFDIVVASLSLHYIKNLKRLIKEIKRVLKPKGIFCFSVPNPVLSSGLKKYNPKNHSFLYLLGEVFDKNKKRIIYGNYFKEGPRKVEFGMKSGKKQFVTMIHRTYQTYINMLVDDDFEIIGYADCKPVPAAKKFNKSEYERNKKLPAFCIFKTRLK